jgi:fucose permease
MSTFLKNNLGFTIAKGSLAVGVFWIAMTIGRFICGQLSLKFKTRNIIIVLAYSSFVITAASLLISGETASWIGIPLMGFAFSSIWPLIVGYGGEYRKTSSATVFSMLVGCGGVGATVIPFCMGLIGSVSGTRIPMLLPLVSFLLIGIIFTVFDRGKKNGNSLR